MTKSDDNETNTIINKGDGRYETLVSAVNLVDEINHMHEGNNHTD